MNPQGDEFFQKLLATFIVEAKEHTQALLSGLGELAAGSPPEREEKLLEVLYREAHSLKGAARSVANREIEAVCHELESLFAALKKNKTAPSAENITLLKAGGELLPRLVVFLERAPGAADRAAMREEIKAFQEKVRQAGGSPSGSPVALSEATETPSIRAGDPAPLPRSPVPGPGAATVRVNIDRLESLLKPAEELLRLKLSLNHRVREGKALQEALAEGRKKGAGTYRWQRLLQQVMETGRGRQGEAKEIQGLATYLEANQQLLEEAAARVADLVKSSRQAARLAGNVSDDWREALRRALMLPFSWLWESYPFFVADLAREQGKRARLVVKGAELEIDRRVLEEMKDAFTHMVRNALDHGLETPEERLARGKSPEGTLTIEASPRGGNWVEVVIADDGAGLDLDKIKAAAVKMGLLSSADAAVADEKVLSGVLFHSGLSTRTQVTSLSGRGLGLAIVREKLDSLGGSVRLESQPNGGTRFILAIPLTRAAFRVVVFREGDRLFALPVNQVERVARIKKTDVITVENKPAFSWRGGIVPLISLGELLGLASASQEDDYLQLLIIRQTGHRLAFKVTEIIDEQEALVKGLGAEVKSAVGIGAMAVLGSGNIVPILNAAELGKLAKRKPSETYQAKKEEEKSRKDYSLLIVEDSITSRTLLKNILETAGYQVHTAVDGVDALLRLSGEEFDLVVSDVEMPRMNGLELTRRIRREEKHASLPVILVTSRHSPEDREEGLLAGASAYIVKSDFDQGNLLAVIERYL